MFDRLDMSVVARSDSTYSQSTSPFVSVFRKRERLYCIIINQQHQYSIMTLDKNSIVVLKDFKGDERFAAAVSKLQLSETNHKWRWDERLGRVVLWKINSKDLPDGPHARSLSVTMYTFKPDV